MTKNNYKPILFSGPMVQAIIRGEKTQTRRIIDPQPIDDQNSGCFFDGKCRKQYKHDIMHEDWRIQFIKDWCRYQVGDVLWVRESFLTLEPEHCDGVMANRFYYKADHIETNEEWLKECIADGYLYKWTPSIHMPKKSARLFLRVTGIRIERLNDINEHDALAEGVERWVEERMKSRPTYYKVYFNECAPTEASSYTSCPIDSFSTLWQLINGAESWDANPWVWVYEFESIEAPDDWKEQLRLN